MKELNYDMRKFLWKRQLKLMPTPLARRNCKAWAAIGFWHKGGPGSRRTEGRAQGNVLAVLGLGHVGHSTHSVDTHRKFGEVWTRGF